MSEHVSTCFENFIFKLRQTDVTATAIASSGRDSRKLHHSFTCDSKWGICTCKTFPVFSRLIEYEARAQRLFFVVNQRMTNFLLRGRKNELYV